MTKEEIAKIKEHIEIHARQEPRAVRITEIMQRAVTELERIAELEKENAELKLKLEALEGQTPWKDIKDKSEVIGKLTKAKELLKKFMPYVIESYLKQDISNIKLSFDEIEKAEQFLKENA